MLTSKRPLCMGKIVNLAPKLSISKMSWGPITFTNKNTCKFGSDFGNKNTDKTRLESLPILKQFFYLKKCVQK